MVLLKKGIFDCTAGTDVVEEALGSVKFLAKSMQGLFSQLSNVKLAGMPNLSMSMSICISKSISNLPMTSLTGPS